VATSASGHAEADGVLQYLGQNHQTLKALVLKGRPCLGEKGDIASWNCSPPELEAKTDSQKCAFIWDNMFMIKHLLNEGA